MEMGWVKLHRKSIQSTVFRNERRWKVWTYCLMRANHTTAKIPWNGSEVELHPGQFITGRFEGAKDCQLAPSTFWNHIKALEKMGNLDIKSDNKNSIVSIVKWTVYQSRANNSDTNLNINPDINRTATEHRQEGENEENDFVRRAKGYMAKHNIRVDDYVLDTRLTHAFLQYGERVVKSAIVEAVQGWAKSQKKGNFPAYLFSILRNNYLPSKEASLRLRQSSPKIADRHPLQSCSNPPDDIDCERGSEPETKS